MTDLTKLDAANQAIQKQATMAKTTKAFDQAATDAIHSLDNRITALENPTVPPVTPPAGGLVIAPPQQPLTTVPPIYLPTNLPGTTEKQRVTTSPTDGLRLMKWPPAKSTGRYTLRDLQVDHVAASPPRSADGTKEAGYWIGQTSDAYRLVAEDCAWMGLWTGCMVDGSDIHDIELLKMPHVGIYCEHITRNTHFHNFRVQIIDNPAKEAAVKCEWWYRNPTYGPMLPYNGLSGTYSNTFENFEIIIPPGVWAFRLEPGTFDTTIRNGKIIYTDPDGPGNLGISHPTILVDPAKPNKIEMAVVGLALRVLEALR